MEILLVLGGFGLRKTKPIQTQSYLAPRSFGGRKTKLKKQSQFTGGANGANSYMKGIYGNKLPCRAGKKQTQSNPIYSILLNWCLFALICS